MRYLFWLIIPIVCLNGCSGCNHNAEHGEEGHVHDENCHHDHGPSNADLLIGTWASEYIKTEIFSPNGIDTTSQVIDAKKDEFMTKLGITGTLGTYYDDGTFDSKYLGAGDTIMFESGGNWEVDGDSLYLSYKGYDGSDQNNTYYFIIDEQSAAFSGFVDWDGDGAKDDTYYADAVRVEEE